MTVSDKGYWCTWRFPKKTIFLSKALVKYHPNTISRLKTMFPFHNRAFTVGHTQSDNESSSITIKSEW